MVDFGTPLADGVQVPPRALSPAPARSSATRSSRPTTWMRPSPWPRDTLTSTCQVVCTIEVHAAQPVPGM